MDRPLAPWELEQQAEALAELKGSSPDTAPEAQPIEVPIEAVATAETHDAEALKRAERQLMIQQVEKMIAAGKAESGRIQQIQETPSRYAEFQVLRLLFSKHSLAIGVGLLLVTFVVLLLVMMNFVGRMASGIAVPTQ